MLTCIARRWDSACWNRRGGRCAARKSALAYYIDVRDVDQLYEELKPKLDMLPKGDVYGPVNQTYGQRELLVLAPDGNLIAFGAAIRAD